MMRRGSILVFSLLTMSVMVIIAGSLCSYFVGTARLSKEYLTRDRGINDRILARQALRLAMEPLIEAFEGQTSQQGSGVQVAVGGSGNRGLSIDQLVTDMKAAVKEKYGDGVVLRETRGDNSLKLTAIVGGVPIMSVEIEFSRSSVWNTLEIFNYVYFANNNGQLTSSCIIANGDVGSNGDFTLKGATVNGYVRCLGTVSVSGTPHAWLQGAYLAKAATEFDSVFVPVRPTNPIVYEVSGVTKTVAWPGGYESIYAKNPYEWKGGNPPAVVANPGDPPTKPTKEKNVTYLETSSSQQPSNPPSR